MRSKPALCRLCVHLDEDSGLSRCVAYPDGIPNEIVEMDVVHLEPYEGDGGIIFSPKPGVNLADENISRITLDEEVDE